MEASMTLTKRLISGFAIAVLLTVPLYAKLVTSAEYTGNTTGAGTFLMPLNNAGATSIAFGGKGRHVISYSAECNSSGGSWGSIQIILDGVALDPTAGVDDAFCAPGDNLWRVASYVVATPNLGAGLHTVQVQATAVGGGTIRLGNTSLVIEK
jgi:hypothetical protein